MHVFHLVLAVCFGAAKSAPSTKEKLIDLLEQMVNSSSHKRYTDDFHTTMFDFIDDAQFFSIDADFIDFDPPGLESTFDLFPRLAKLLDGRNEIVFDVMEHIVELEKIDLSVLAGAKNLLQSFYGIFATLYDAKGSSADLDYKLTQRLYTAAIMGTEQIGENPFEVGCLKSIDDGQPEIGCVLNKLHALQFALEKSRERALHILNKDGYVMRQCGFVAGDHIDIEEIPHLLVQLVSIGSCVVDNLMHIANELGRPDAPHYPSLEEQILPKLIWVKTALELAEEQTHVIPYSFLQAYLLIEKIWF